LRDENPEASIATSFYPFNRCFAQVEGCKNIVKFVISSVLTMCSRNEHASSKQ